MLVRRQDDAVILREVGIVGFLRQCGALHDLVRRKERIKVLVKLFDGRLPQGVCDPDDHSRLHPPIGMEVVIKLNDLADRLLDTVGDLEEAEIRR